MAEQNQQYRKPLPKTAFNEFKLRMSARKLEGANRRPTLAFSLVKNNPRITVRTELETDKNKGVVAAPMDAPTFYAFLELLNKAIESDSDCGWYIENKNHTYEGGERSREPVVMSKTIVGKDEEGRVFIGVSSRGITPVKFIFGSSYYHALSDKGGSALTEAEASCLYAKGYIKLLTNLTASVMDTHYTEPEPRQYGGGNNNRGGQSSGGGGQTSSAPSQPSGGDDAGWNGDNFPM